MDYEHLKAAKQLYDVIANLCDTIDEKELVSFGGSIKLKEVLQVDIAEFIMYLTASDGRVSIAEVETYRYITGFGGETIESVKNFIEENGIYSYDFESEPPLILKLFLKAENNAILRGLRPQEYSLLDGLEALYEAIGKVVISSDGGISYNERRDYNIYLKTIHDFIEENKRASFNRLYLED